MAGEKGAKSGGVRKKEMAWNVLRKQGVPARSQNRNKLGNNMPLTVVGGRGSYINQIRQGDLSLSTGVSI
jgi:hypothetical protein